LLHLINEILDLTKIDAGRMELTNMDFDLARLVRDLGSMFQLPAEEKNLGLRFDGISTESPQLVHGDQAKLRQVLINLIGNSVKFTDSGRISVRIASLGEETWSFSVEDTGPGIPQETQAAIFEPFRRGAIAREHGGTGLGLAIARRQVELMGGQLKVDSTPGTGSRFTFSVALPGPVGASDLERTIPDEVERLADGSQVTALVVDDIADNRDVLTILLRRIGCTVRQAASGAEALTAAAKLQPDIVFLDMRLPSEDGAEVTRQLLEKFGPGGLKVVAMSASALTHEREHYLKTGCDDFVAKPFRAERIYDSLKTLLGASFVYRAPEYEPVRATIDLSSLIVPQDLLVRLTMAAELHSATALKSCLKELEGVGPAGERFAQHLRSFLASYDMATIQKLVAQLSTEPACAEALS
jgi:CheY-like chemotaxis protein